MDSLTRWLALVTLVSAALAAVLYLARVTWQGFKAMDRLGVLLQHELTPNHGSSMKDELTRIAQSVGRLQRDVRDLTVAKQTAHELLQLQLDTVARELGLQTEQHPQHRREDEQ